jgi:hypothetical protein
VADDPLKPGTAHVLNQTYATQLAAVQKDIVVAESSLLEVKRHRERLEAQNAELLADLVTLKVTIHCENGFPVLMLM